MEVALVQLAITDDLDKSQRIDKAETMIKNTLQKTDKMDLVLLPELWGCGFFNHDRYKQLAEEPKGETFQRLAPLAKKFGTWILAGSVVERQGDRFFNTSLLIDRSGKLVEAYRKIHLFGYESEENKILTPGRNVVTVSTDFGKVGITTCYDLRFPELYRQMVDQGAEIFLIVADWPYSRIEHWRLFNCVRALENQCMLVSCNATGTLRGVLQGGNSMVVDPWGKVIATGGIDEEIVCASIDVSEVKKNRESFPALHDRVLNKTEPFFIMGN